MHHNAINFDPRAQLVAGFYSIVPEDNVATGKMFGTDPDRVYMNYQDMIGVCAVGYEGKSTLTTSIVMLTMCIGRFVTPLLMAWLTAAVSADAGMYVAPVSGLLGVAFGLLAMRRPAAE